MPHGQLQLRRRRRRRRHCRLQHGILNMVAKALIKVRTTRVPMDGRALEATRAVAAAAAAAVGGISGCQRHLDVRINAACAVQALQIAASYNCNGILDLR